MSLVNDALKRARQAQPMDAPAGPLPMPVESTSSLPGGAGLWLPVLLALVVLLSAALFWQWFHGASHVVAQPLPPAPVAAAPVAATPPVIPPAPVVETTVPMVVSNEAVVATKPVAPVPPPAPTYKLQGIFYRVQNPGAVINGKDVAVGSQVGEMRVVAISRNSVTLADAGGKTNVMTLP